MPHTNVRFVVCVILICWTASVLPASAQHFKQIPATLNVISAGRAEVWGVRCAGLCSDAKVYRFNSSTHLFVQVTAPPTGLESVVVGGGTLLQPDEVWGIQNNNTYDVYHFNFKTNAFVKVPGPSLTQIAVGRDTRTIVIPMKCGGLGAPMSPTQRLTDITTALPGSIKSKPQARSRKSQSGPIMSGRSIKIPAFGAGTSMRSGTRPRRRLAASYRATAFQGSLPEPASRGRSTVVVTSMTGTSTKVAPGFP